MTTRNHDELVAAFGHGWRRPHAHAWDDLLAEDVELVQPLLRTGTGRRLWQEEMQRLLAFLPDLTGQVTTWAARDRQVFVVLALTATAGGRPLHWRVVDHLSLNGNGRIIHRESFYDTAPLISALLSRPTAWMGWWRSGVGPLPGRRILMPARRPSARDAT